MNPYRIINPETIKSSMMNNMDMVKQLISLYLTQGKDDFKNLEQVINEGSLSDIASKAHHIKPTMEYIGASDLRLAFQGLEKAARENTAMEDIKALYFTIKTDFDIAMSELEDYASTLS